MIEPLKKLLDNAVKRAGIARGILAAVVCEEFKKIIIELYGQGIINNIKQVSFHDSILRIKCTEPAVAQNLRINRIRIMNELNQRLGKKTVKELYAVVY